MTQTSRLEFGQACCLMIIAQLILTGLVTHFTPLSTRPLAMVVCTVVLMMSVTTLAAARKPTIFAAIFLSTMLSALGIYAWRMLVDRTAFMGSVPSSLEIPSLGVSAALTVFFASIAALASDRASRAYPLRWGIVMLFSVVFVGGLWRFSSGRLQMSSALPMQLQRVVAIEAARKSASLFERQDLSFWLGTLGRGSEAQAFSTRDAQVRDRGDMPGDVPTELQTEIAKAVAWREAITQIAARERIVIIMEAHNATQHREWIEQTLPIFHQAGFRHYAAEALFEAGAALKKRGYPLLSTGAYVADPRFGNLLRRAIELDFAIHEYEAHLASHIPQREEQQAQTLANILAANPGGKFVIHVGYAHSFKQPVPGIGPWMAARLWEKTGIEPYCIYQAHEEYDSPSYPKLVELAGATEEPKLLVPYPSGLTAPQFTDIPDGAIDALVIHPLSKGKPPAARQPVFSSGMTQITGRWRQHEWPVVIGAYRTGETEDAIALDQVMLRPGESDFELWIPAQAYNLRATLLTGNIDVDVQEDEKGILLIKPRASTASKN